MATQTLWGQAQQSKKIAKGIMLYSTASHGGFHVSNTRQKDMLPFFKLEDGWYEEDCDWCLVILAFPEYFKPSEYVDAISCMKNWHPDRYEEWTGCKLTPEDSYIRRQQAIDNADKFLQRIGKES